MKRRRLWAARIAILGLVTATAIAGTVTSNMSLQSPSSGDTDYPTQVTNSLTLIDAHDHTSGKGVQIPTGGIANTAVTAAKIATAVAGDGLAGGGGAAFSVNVDGASIEINSDTLRVKANGITRDKLVALGQQVSSATNYSNNSSSAYADVTSFTVTITTSSANRPVFIGVVCDGSTITFGSPLDNAASGVYRSGGSSTEVQYVPIRLLRDSTVVADTYTNYDVGATGGGFLSFYHIDTGTSASTSYTYKVQTYSPNGRTMTFKGLKLIAYEL